MRILLAITGTTPLVYHNIRLADRNDPITKQITELSHKRVKTEEDLALIEQLEFIGGLYYDPEVGVYLPSWNVARSFEEGARLSKLGASLIRALSLVTDRVPVDHDGPADPVGLWARPEFRWRAMVGVQRSKVARMRPRFARWGLTLEAELSTDLLDPDQLLAVASEGGRVAGLGDARKLGYGRYSVEMA